MGVSLSWDDNGDTNSQALRRDQDVDNGEIEARLGESVTLPPRLAKAQRTEAPTATILDCRSDSDAKRCPHSAAAGGSNGGGEGARRSESTSCSDSSGVGESGDKGRGSWRCDADVGVFSIANTKYEVDESPGLAADADGTSEPAATQSSLPAGGDVVFDGASSFKSVQTDCREQVSRGGGGGGSGSGAAALMDEISISEGETEDLLALLGSDESDGEGAAPSENINATASPAVVRRADRSNGDTRGNSNFGTGSQISQLWAESRAATVARPAAAAAASSIQSQTTQLDCAPAVAAEVEEELLVPAAPVVGGRIFGGMSLVFVTSTMGLTEQRARIFSRQVRQYGGLVYDQFRAESTTHLIVGCKKPLQQLLDTLQQRLGVERTTLNSVSILTCDWVCACLQTRPITLHPEEAFTADLSGRLKPYAWRRRAQPRGAAHLTILNALLGTGPLDVLAAGNALVPAAAQADGLSDEVACGVRRGELESGAVQELQDIRPSCRYSSLARIETSRDSSGCALASAPGGAAALEAAVVQQLRRPADTPQYGPSAALAEICVHWVQDGARVDAVLSGPMLALQKCVSAHYGCLFKTNGCRHRKCTLELYWTS
eukprot:SAG11_NODE_2517_length_3265_cov_1.739419_3_plen_605_part_00